MEGAGGGSQRVLEGCLERDHLPLHKVGSVLQQICVTKTAYFFCFCFEENNMPREKTSSVITKQSRAEPRSNLCATLTQLLATESGLIISSVLSRARVWISGFATRVSGLGLRVSGVEIRVPGFGFRVQVLGAGFEFRVSGLGFRVSGLGFHVRVSDFGFRVSGFRFGSKGCMDTATWGPPFRSLIATSIVGAFPARRPPSFG